MVATTLAVASATALVTYEAAQRVTVHRDGRIDSGIKAAVGLGAGLASIKVKQPMLKGALLGAGVGLVGAAAAPYVPFLG